jgi:hypothetical protein
VTIPIVPVIPASELTFLASLAEEQQRNTQYAQNPAPSVEAELGGKYLPDADEYFYYEMFLAEPQHPAIVVFTKATIDRGARTRIFRIGADVMYRVVEWKAIRRGQWPQYMKVDESDGPLVYREVRPQAPPPDGPACEDFYFTILGKYVYVLSSPKSDTDTVVSPRLPYLACDIGRRSIDETVQTDLLSSDSGQ